MAITPGTSLGPYEITSAIGAGGMGEVYKARDTRLNRDVAIKILPPSFSSRPEMKQRFEREAQTNRKLWSVDVKASPSTFEPGVPKLVFESRIYSTTSANNNPFPYDVSADGQRFLITSIPPAATTSEPLTVVLNWYAGLKAGVK